MEKFLNFVTVYMPTDEKIFAGTITINNGKK